jgi:hypothetical protein
MSIYNVSIWVKYPDGTENKYETFVDEDNEEDAIYEAKSHLPVGTRILKIIFVAPTKDEF